MSGMTKELQKLFYKGEQFLDNAAADPEAASLLAERGIDAAALSEGRGLYDAAKAAVAQGEGNFATQLQATDDFKAALDASWKETQDVARILASAYEGQTEQLALLGLHKRRDESTGESEVAWPRVKTLPTYLPWARNLSARITTGDLAATAARFGYDAETVAAIAARVEAVSDLDDAQERAKAHARQSTEDRNAAAEAFKGWLKQQTVVARVALRGKKRLLELLGLR